MAVWALADLHLSFGVPDKKMDVFGDNWIDYTDKVKEHWHALIKPDDLVLIAGDISWAMRPEDAIPDLQWIHEMPGTKVMIRGNHDYWWASVSKVEKVLPPSIHILQNNAFLWRDIAVGGARLWDTAEYRFNGYIDFKENARSKKLTVTDNDLAETEKVFVRELSRLELSLKALSKDATKRVVMTHYPPISATLELSRAAEIIEKYQINECVFGHLHNVKRGIPMFGTKNDVTYHLTSCDFLDFIPKKIYD